MSTTTDNEGSTEQTTSVTAPLVDTSMTLGIWGDKIKARHAVAAAPILFPLAVAIGAALTGVLWVAAGSLVVAMLLTPPLFRIEQKNPLYRSVPERIARWRANRTLKQSLPWGPDDVRGNEEALHGVKRIDYAPSGGAAPELADGRVCGLVELNGSPTAMQEQSEATTFANQYERVLDEEIEDFDVAVYSTTMAHDPETVVGGLLDRATGAVEAVATTAAGTVPEGLGEGRRGRVVREFLTDVADWFMTEDEEQWAANHFRHFVIVDVSEANGRVEEDVRATAENPGGERSRRSWLPSFLPFVGGTARGEAGSQSERRQAQRDVLDDRLTAIERAMASIDGVEAQRCDVLTTSEVLLQFWSGVETEPGDAVLNAFRRDEAELSGYGTATERWLAPDRIDVDGSVVEIGDQLARTFSVTPGSWPAHPEPHFLGDLYTMREVDLDVKWHLGAEDKPAAISAIEDEGPRVGIELDDRADAGDWSARTIQSDQQALQSMHQALTDTAAQPWQVSLYVTVRVGPEEAYRVIEKSGIQDVEVAKRKALDDHSKKVRNTLTTNKAGLGLQTDQLATLALFRSSSPLGQDYYDSFTGPSKRTRMTGAAVAASLPFATGHLVEAQGRRWGRDKQTGLPVRASLYERGAAPHAFTFGQSRSGKTYDVLTADAEWYLENPDERTLIVCDTEGGFEALTELCGGKHIVVDGTETINPLHIEQPPRHVLERERGKGYSHLEMKVDEVVEFFCAVIREQGGDPSDYFPILDSVVRDAYQQRGIREDPRTHGKESPTPQDVIDLLGEQLEDPASVTWKDNEAEVAKRKDKVAELLDLLSAFKPGNRLDFMRGATDAGLLTTDANMIYIDLSQASADDSIMLHLILGQLYQRVKRRGKFKFTVDEAHHLLHSEEMVEYLEDAARAWARYDASLHFVTQNPREFIERAQSTDQGAENKRKTILEQCSTIQAFRTPQIDDERHLLRQLGMNDTQAEWITSKAVQGKMGHGYSECLVNFQDQDGWYELHVEASPFQDLLWIWNPRLHETDLFDYLDKWWDWERHEKVGAGPPTDPERVEAAGTPDPLNHIDGRNVGIEESDVEESELPPGASQAPVETLTRDVERCLAITSDDSRCSRTARSDGFCYQHDESNRTIDDYRPQTTPADD